MTTRKLTRGELRSIISEALEKKWAIYDGRTLRVDGEVYDAARIVREESDAVQGRMSDGDRLVASLHSFFERKKITNVQRFAGARILYSLPPFAWFETSQLLSMLA